MPPASTFYVGAVNGELVCHLAVACMFNSNAYRATRLVVMPEWQGAGVGIKFLNAVCQFHLDGSGRAGRKLGTFFHTSHPQLCAALRGTKGWRQTGAMLYGSNKIRSRESIQRTSKSNCGKGAGYGGHFRAVQAFKYIGNEEN